MRATWARQFGLVHSPYRQTQCYRLWSTSLRRCYSSTVAAQSKVPDFGFAFDIDGVLLRSAKPLPGAAESLSRLQKQHIPFILLTNGGGMHETDRIGQLNKRLNASLDPSVIIQSHTPFAELVKGKKEQGALEDKRVLVVGGPDDKCRKVAELYGFKSVVTPGDIFMAYPEIWPFSAGFSDYYKRCTQPLQKSIDPIDPSKSLKIDAILVFNDPRDWALDIQIIIDVLLSSQGIVGTLSDKNNRPGLPNRGYQQDEQPHLYISNPDLLWAASYHQPRLGQGGFCAALDGVWAAVTGGATLNKTLLGKPHQSTYEYAEKRLIQQREAMYGKQDIPLRSVYMIGDNPESDIRGANSYVSDIGAEWHSVLVRSGVYDGGEPAWPPRTIVDGVKQGVEWGFKNSQWELSPIK